MQDTTSPDTGSITQPRSILFVCTGNICRSPTAEGVTHNALVSIKKPHEFRLDSAGVDSHHIGQPPDPRSQKIALQRGVDISDLRARNVTQDDFSRFDLILAMDNTHLAALTHMMSTLPTNSVTAELALYLPYTGIAHHSDVPDPYYGNEADFIDVFDLINQATDGLIRKILS
jgi:protein-tyrosine phosphatase